VARAAGDKMKRRFINESKVFWDSGEPIKAGEILYEHIRNDHRPVWAAAVLAYCQESFPLFPEIQTVLEIANESKRWPEAHEAFQAVRRLYFLQSEAPLDQDFLYLAELVAKVTYNASGRSAPFDHNSGWKLVAALHKICSIQNNSKFSDGAWYVVSCEKYSDA
jgi:hypothetical protein